MSLRDTKELIDRLWPDGGRRGDLNIYPRVRDRSRWGSGPWDDEPDKVQWEDPATGLPCLIVRNQLGGLCGYVGVDPGHPFHGRDVGDCPEGCGDEECEHAPCQVLQAHGKVNYADACQKGPAGSEGGTVCHVPAPGAPDAVWWFGFDCCHAWDVIPGLDGGFDWGGAEKWRGEYRGLEYVKGKVEGLAAQLAAFRSTSRGAR